MIADYLGDPRQGKTFNAVYDLNRLLRQGRRVITNTPFFAIVNGKQINAEFYPDADEFMYYMLAAKAATVFIDEASLYFSSLRWNKINLDFFAKFRQAGKQSCDLIMTAQSFLDVAASLRKMVDTYNICTKRRWLIDGEIDFRSEKLNKKTGFTELRGLCIRFPYVYDMMRVKKEYFLSGAIHEENKEQWILGKRRLYPSLFRKYSKHYNHEYEITSSAVGDLEAFGKYSTYQEFKEAGGFNDRHRKI